MVCISPSLGGWGGGGGGGGEGGEREERGGGLLLSLSAFSTTTRPPCFNRRQVGVYFVLISDNLFHNFAHVVLGLVVFSWFPCSTVAVLAAWCEETFDLVPSLFAFFSPSPVLHSVLLCYSGVTII